MSAATPVSAGARRLLVALAARGRRRADGPALWAALAEAAPDALGAVDARARLAHLLHELRAAGFLAWSRELERSAEPPLPHSVAVLTVPGRPQPRPPDLHGYHADLGWVPGLRPAPNPRQTALLQRVNAWLRDGGRDAPLVPVAERALQLGLGEKGWRELVRSQLYGPGRLTPELLRCEESVPPLFTEEVGHGDALLVAENDATFRSLVRVLRERAQPWVGLVAFGGGNLFERAVVAVRGLGREIGAIAYFGDLDAAGLRIPASASLRAVEAGLPPVRPAAGLYRLLLAVGAPERAGDPLSGEKARALGAWLPPELAAAGERLLAGGERLAQEWVGYERLRANPSWREDLT